MVGGWRDILGLSCGIPAASRIAPAQVVSATLSTVTADEPLVIGRGQSNITVRLLDTDGSPVVGHQIVLTGQYSVSIQAVNSITDADGEALFQVSNNFVDEYIATFSARDSTDGVNISQIATVVFGTPTPKTPNAKNIVLGNVYQSRYKGKLWTVVAPPISHYDFDHVETEWNVQWTRKDGGQMNTYYKTTDEPAYDSSQPFWNRLLVDNSLTTLMLNLSNVQQLKVRVRERSSYGTWSDWSKPVVQRG